MRPHFFCKVIVSALVIYFLYSIFRNLTTNDKPKEIIEESGETHPATDYVTIENELEMMDFLMSDPDFDNESKWKDQTTVMPKAIFLKSNESETGVPVPVETMQQNKNKENALVADVQENKQHNESIRKEVYLAQSKIAIPVSSITEENTSTREMIALHQNKSEAEMHQTKFKAKAPLVNVQQSELERKKSEIPAPVQLNEVKIEAIKKLPSSFQSNTTKIASLGRDNAGDIVHYENNLH